MKRLIENIRESGKLKAFFEDNKDMLIKVAAVAVVIVAAFFVFAPESEEDGISEAEETIVESEPAAAGIFVGIGGEVNEPMVAELKEGSRVEDAIEAAGGLTENADISEINRAAFLEDGEKIFIPPVVDESMSGSSGGSSSSGSAAYYSDGKININTADSLELQELDGVGPVTAEKIIDYREENGRFGDIEDIKNVSGIGDKTFEKLKDDIKV